MSEEFEKSPSRLAYEREVFSGMSDPADWSPETKSHMEMFFRIWDMAWQASRKQALSECADICHEEGNEWDSDAVITIKNYAHACRNRIRAMVKVSIPSLLEKQTTVPATVPVPRADVDQLVASTAVRAEEIDAEVVNAGGDGIQSNFGAATDADPHDRLLSEGADLHDRQTGPSVQAVRAENTALISADTAVNSLTPHCDCQTCRPITAANMRMVLCPTCGNKRCPHANDHRNACTSSNEPGQPGSAYPRV